MELKTNYILVTIPQGATPEQLDRIVGVARESLRGLETQVGVGISEMATVHVTATDPAEELQDIPF